jgi:glucose/arabinose dehydrogenase
MWGMDHGINFLGDDQQKEEHDQSVQGVKYSWPYIYEAGKPWPVIDFRPPSGVSIVQWAKQAQALALLYTAHTAPMQIAFYSGLQSPVKYREDPFVATHDSWNRQPSSDYEIVRIEFDDRG